MRGWSIPVVLVFAAACSSDDRNGPGVPPDVPASLGSTTLDGAIALTWSDNSYTSDPGNFLNYRIYSTTYDLDQDPLCGTSFQLEGDHRGPGVRRRRASNGVPRCFTVTAVSVDGFESDRSPLRSDTPRPDTRNVVLYAFQFQTAGSGFRFWDDLNGDGLVQGAELGLVRSGSGGDIDFVVDRDGAGDLFLTPGARRDRVEYYDANNPVEVLTSIDFAEDRTYLTSGILALPGYGYVFEMDGGDGFKRYGAVRVSHVGQLPDSRLGVPDRSGKSGADRQETVIFGVGEGGLREISARFRLPDTPGWCPLPSFRLSALPSSLPLPPAELLRAMAKTTCELDGRSLTVAEVVRVARDVDVRVTVAPAARGGSARQPTPGRGRHRLGADRLRVNTGFGSSPNVVVAARPSTSRSPT